MVGTLDALSRSQQLRNRETQKPQSTNFRNSDSAQLTTSSASTDFSKFLGSPQFPQVLLQEGRGMTVPYGITRFVFFNPQQIT